MKTSHWQFLSSVGLTVGLLVCPAQAGGPVTRRGTSVMHYMTRNALVSTEAGSNVVGWLRLQQNEQGHAAKQSLRLLVTGLETNAPYNLVAVVGDDTNTVVVAALTADRHGRGRVSYLSHAQGRGGPNPLPDGLSPLTEVRSIGLENGSTQTVAYAWIADADQFQYLVKRNLTPEDTNDAAAGSISLIANQQRVHFRLLAGGLGAGNDYHLALNSNIVTTVQADTAGRIEMKDWPVSAPSVRELHSLALLDGGSNVVLFTQLPK